MELISGSLIATSDHISGHQRNHTSGQAPPYPHLMVKNASQILADNVRGLMKGAGDISQREASKRAGISQSSLGYVLNYRDAQDRHATTGTIEALAKAFELEPWQLLAPELGAKLQGKVKPAIVDRQLLADSLATAMHAFRTSRKLPTEVHIAAAATFVYVHVQTGKRMKDAEQAVQSLLAKAGDVVPDFK